MKDRLDCKCGSKLWGYKGDVGYIYVCYKCGKYKGQGLHPMLMELTMTDPTLLLQMIDMGVFKKFENEK